MKPLKSLAIAALAAVGIASGASAAGSEESRQVPKLMIVGIGNIESMTEVEKWLGTTVVPQQPSASLPNVGKLGKAEAGAVPERVQVDWSSAKLELTRETDMITAENIANRKWLNDVRMKVITDDASRYVPLAVEYLTAAVSRRSNGRLEIIDRTGNAEGLAWLLTGTLGDQERDAKTIPVSSGTKVRVTTYTQPYTFKIRDLNGRIVMADSGTASWTTKENSVVATESANPARKLVEAVCEKIAARILGDRDVTALDGAAVDDQALASKPGRKTKWLVLDPITYQTGVDKTTFEGIDQLLLTRLVQAKKYKCLDRDAYDTAAREEGFGGKADLIPAGYSMRGEIVQLLKSGKSRTLHGTAKAEYIATVSIRANDLKTQQPYEAETLRVTAYCQTPKDMLVYVVQRVALAILMRDYPMYVMDYDEDEAELTLSYGADFLNVGEQYEIRRRKAIVDDDTGETVYKEKTVGVCEVTDVGKNTSTAKLTSGKAKAKDVLRFYDSDEGAAPPLPPQPTASVAQPVPKPSVRAGAKPRIAVAPFITKQKAVSIWGVSLSTRDWCDTVIDHLSIQLTQTGSFRTLDRSFGPEIDRELDRIVNDPNASEKDVCRLSKKLATDYLVVAEVMFSDVASPGKDYVTGLPLPPASAQFAEVRFRCVHAPTTEIVVSDIVRVDSKDFYGTPAIFTSGSSEWAAANLAAIIQSKLDPAGFARRQAELKAAAEAAAAAAAAAKPAPAPVAPAPTQGIKLGF